LGLLTETGKRSLIRTCRYIDHHGLPLSHFARPSQLIQFPPWGAIVPTPRQTWQVLAIRNPLSTTNVLVPVPLQAERLVRLIPGFRPAPMYGVTSVVFLVPLHESTNGGFEI